MEDKKIRKLEITFKAAAWMLVAVAVLSVSSIVTTIIKGDEVSVFLFVLKNIEVILASLFLAAICFRTKVTEE